MHEPYQQALKLQENMSEIENIQAGEEMNEETPKATPPKAKKAKADKSKPSGWRVARRQFRIRPGSGPGLDASRLMRPCGRLAADESNRLTGPRASVLAG
jgi:hypothetical protein